MDVSGSKSKVTPTTMCVYMYIYIFILSLIYCVYIKYIIDTKDIPANHPHYSHPRTENPLPERSLEVKDGWHMN